ncbi:MAG TPA: D-isomer specific 2-hydroxyacid dehydrogenase family protein [Actinomycetota bacterium]|nr:D-isomer specific 2-hydroxyacid dehydrogenase family protein [Actinomycetota bacterium]
MGARPRIAIGPRPEAALLEIVTAAGGEGADAADADAVVWTDPRDPQGLKALLASSPARWVQLPFAGIESFFAAGVIDPQRTWTCAKGIYGPATAEHALTLMLASARRLHEHVRATTWRDTTFGAPERRLAGMTVLLVGTGGIGTALARMLEPLGPRLIAANRSGRSLRGAESTSTIADLPQLLPEADQVVLAAALTPATEGLLGADAFALMRSDAWVVNVARGGLVQTDALVDALRNGTIGGAALDVTDPEPLPDEHPLWSLPNVIITPHVANTWDMAVPELLALVRRNVEAFAAGRDLEGLVDTDAGY